MTIDELVKKIEEASKHPAFTPYLYNENKNEIGIDGVVNLKQAELIVQYLKEQQ